MRVLFVLFVRENRETPVDPRVNQIRSIPPNSPYFAKVGQKDMASVPSPVEFDVSPVVGFVPEKEPLVSKVLKTYRK